MIKKILHRLKHYVQSPRWFIGFIIAITLSGFTFLLNYWMAEIQPGNTWGITYGVIAAILMISLALYGVRRRTMKWGWGKSKTWLQFHLYGGMLFLVMMLMHSGFQEPVGILTWLLWFFSIWVAISGLLGVFIQKWIPKMLSSGLTIEVLYDRIPELIQDIRNKIEKLAAKSHPSVRDYYYDNLAATFAGPQMRLVYYIDITGGAHAHTKQFDYLRQLLPAKEKHKLNRLEEYYKAKLEIDAHYTLQKALRGWLYLHVPVSLLLIVLLILHLYTVLWY